MASVYESNGGVAPEVSSTAIIPKPTGLAVGDSMFAFFCSNGSSITTHTPPDGWSVVVTTAEADRQKSTVYHKLAESADVSASTFTFSSNGSSLVCGGIIARVSSSGIIAGSSADSLLDSAGTDTFAGFTPTRANCLYLFFVGLGRSGSSDSNYSSDSISMATSNPSWTKQTELDYDVTNETHSLALWTATRPEITATGDITHTYTNTGSTKSVNGLLIAVSPRIDGSVTPTTKINAYALTGIQSIKVNALTEDASVSESFPTQWTNKTKPADPTWINKDK